MGQEVPVNTATNRIREIINKEDELHKFFGN